jgi:FtsP/CotA-like multicopper oxidase with cupredoxin domain
MREVVPVSPGITYKFKFLNGGSMYALRISFDALKMTIVAADSEQVEPVVKDDNSSSRLGASRTSCQR